MYILLTFDKYLSLSEPFYFDQSKLITLYIQAIGRAPTLLSSHWSKWFIFLLLQQSYAIKDQQKARNALSRGLWVP